MKTFSIGWSSQHFPIWAHSFEVSSERRPVLLMGGVHGNEPEGVIVLESLLGDFLRSYSYSFSTYVVSCFNPDGFFARTRVNGRGVDLNRNLPTRDWQKEAFNPKYPPGDYANSESENRALVAWLETLKPALVISVHSFERYMMNINGNCRDFAEAMQVVNGYPIEESIGYPTPGCLGTYCGLERDMPTITYEIERGVGIEQIISVHKQSLLQALNKYEERG